MTPTLRSRQAEQHTHHLSGSAKPAPADHRRSTSPVPTLRSRQAEQHTHHLSGSAKPAPADYRRSKNDA